MNSLAVNKKVCLMGDFGVGKTSLVRRFVYDRFEDKYLSTIGVKVSRKMLMVPQKEHITELNLLLWDLAGSEEFSAVRANYMRGCAGAVVVVDITRYETVTTLRRYLHGLYTVAPNAKAILAANKFDLTVSEETEGLIATLGEQWGVPHYFTSAKTGENVEALFRHMAMLVLTGREKGPNDVETFHR
ncbi:MAG: GTP-binding protein [Anaerolineales bacterium]|nr:GTP-binding protein [Anaerolineales bacterium]MCB9127779.1 GTP-binding protein [Ardenticatenales bacterium]